MNIRLKILILFLAFVWNQKFTLNAQSLYPEKNNISTFSSISKNSIPSFGNRRKVGDNLSLASNSAINCPGNIFVTASANCNAVVTYVSSATGIPTPLISYVFNGATTGSGAGDGSGSTFALGTTTVTLTASNSAGAVSCTFDVVVTDVTAPTLTCPPTQMVSADNACQAILGDYTAGVLNLTATVNSGSSGTSCTDVFLGGAPEPHWDVSIGGQATTTYPQSGICFTNAPNLQFNQSYNLGNYPATIAVCFNAFEDDGASCIVAKTCSVQVCQNFATPAPGTSVTYTLSIPNNGINTSWGTVSFTLQASAITPLASDNCPGVIVAQTPPPGTILNLGNNAVTLTATDIAGNSTACSFNVVVEDTQAPVITCPPNSTVNADNNCQATLGDYTSGSFVNLTATVNSGSSGTSCTDGFLDGAPEPQWDVSIAGQATTTYPQSGICFINAPNLQYNQSYNLGNYPATIAVCFNAFEDDGASCIVAKTCSVQVCQNFATPAPGTSVTYTLSIPNNGINTSWGTVSFTLQASAITPLVSDNCPGVIVTQTPPPGSVLNLGNNNISLTASDLAGNSSSCNFVVTVVDNQAPTISCPATITVSADANLCSYSGSIGTAIATDNCAGVVVSGPIPAAPYSVGINTVTWTATDAAGLTATCTQTIIVEDTQPPTLTCPPTQMVSADNACQAILGDYTAGVLNLTATVNSGSSGTSCIDGFLGGAPEPHWDVSIGGQATTTYPQLGICFTNAPNLQYNQSYNLGNYPATIAVCFNAFEDDGASCIVAKTCSVQVCQNFATPAPGTSVTYTLSIPNNSINTSWGTVSFTLQASAITPLASDNCPGVIVAQTPPPGTILNLGNNAVTLTATDIAGNSTACSFNVVVEDTQAPVITCPPNSTVNADNNCQATLGDYTSGSFVNLTATVNSGSSGTSCSDGFLDGAPEPQWDVSIAGQATTTYPQSGICFTNAPNLQYNQSYNLGNYPATIAVCFNAFEDDGASCIVAKTCSVQVCQNFATPAPGTSVTYTLSIPNNGINTSWGTVSFTLQASAITPLVSDNCPGVIVTQTPPPGSVLNFGNNTISLTASDLAGNSSSCNFVVTVVDNQAPTISCPATITVSADANLCSYSGSIGTAIATDNCAGVVVSGPIPAAPYSVGINTVTWTATDAAGLTATCTQTIIVEDTQPPTLTCPPTQMVSADNACQAILGDYTAGVLNLTATVNSGSSGTSCIDGFLGGAPEPHWDVSIGGQATTTYPQLGICFTNAPNLQFNQSYNLGNYPATIAVCFNAFEDDGASCIVAKTCSVQVCQNFATPAPGTSVTYTLSIPNNGINTSWGTVSFTLQASAITPLASDNCPGVIVAQTPPPGTILNLGNNAVTLTATDIAGNSTACSFNVVVEDTQAPVITCPPNSTVNADNNCQATLGDYTSGSFVNLTATVNSGSSGTSCTDGFLDGAPEPQWDVSIGGQATTTYPQSGICFINAPNLQYNQSYNLGNYPATIAVCFNAFEDDGASCIVAKTCSVQVCQNFATPAPGTSVTYTLSIPNNGINASWGTVSFTLQASAITPLVSDNCPGVIVTQTPPPGSVLNFGNNTISLTASDLAGNSSSCNFVVTVVDNQAPPTTINGNLVICSGGSTTLTASGGNPGTGGIMEWFSDYCGGTLIGTGNSIIVSPTVNTNYYVRYKGMCDTSTCISVLVSVTPNSLIPYLPVVASPYKYGFENAIPPSLFCGMTINNDNFPADLEQWRTSSLEPHSGNNHMAIDANADGITEKNDWFFTAPLNLLSGKLYRLSFWYKSTDAIKTEKLEIYVGTTPYSFDMLLGAAIYSNNSISNVSYLNDSAADFIPSLSGTYYFGFYARSTANQASLYIDDLQVKELVVTQLQPSSCTTLNSLNDQIYATAVPGATDYKYKIENLPSSFSYEYTRNLALNDFRLKWAPGVLYGLTYDVSTAYKLYGQWSTYGASCPVTLGPFPTTKLRVGSCSSTIASLNSVLFCDTVPGATDYEYRIVNTTLGYDHNWLRASVLNNYQLNWAYSSSPLVQGIPYGYTYEIYVRAQVGKTATLPGQWGSFGPLCTVTLSGTPGTQLTPLYCGIGLSSLSSKFFCIPVAGASDYQYRISNASLGYSQIGTRGNSLSDYQLNWLPTSGGGIRYATTYDVEVRAKVGGVYGSFGTICQITTPTAPLTALQLSFCNYTLPSFNSVVNCIAIPGASNYRYHITGPLGYDKVFMRNSGATDWRFSWTLLCCGQQNMQANTSYQVEVESNTGGVWSGYGPSCTITTGASISRVAVPDSEATLDEFVSNAALRVYPNPVSTNEKFAIVLNGLVKSFEKVRLTIYNLTGEIVFTSEISTDEKTELTIHPEINLVPGVYMAETHYNGKMQRVKFVVN